MTRSLEIRRNPSHTAGMRLPLAAVLLLLAAAPALAGPQSTDLGAAANARAARVFNAYRRSHPGGACPAGGGGTRLLLTGFGPFDGLSYNVSGAAVRSMADPAFWPENAPLDSVAPAPDARPDDAAPSSEEGAEAFERSLVIDGRRYDVCFLLLDVAWDSSGAIVAYEESKFRPALVLMTGVGSKVARVESSAYNTADAADADNAGAKPVSTAILPSLPEGQEVPMTWDAGRLAAVVRPDVEALGWRVEAMPRGWPKGEDFICNNVSLVALNASLDLPTELAGGLIRLRSPELAQAPVVGFFHLPPVQERFLELSRAGPEIFGWDKVLARLIGEAAPR